MKNLRNITRALTLIVASAGLAACDPGEDPNDPDDPVDPSCPLWYLDDDGDHYGDANDPGQRHCEDPNDGRVASNTDCDDTKDWVNPSENEVCDGVDNDCDGQFELDCPSGCVPMTLDVQDDGSDKDYLLCTEALRWDAARTTCMQQGYDLAHIDTAEENQVLRNIATSRNVSIFYTGGTDAITEGTWIWPDADEVQFWSGKWSAPAAGTPPEQVFAPPANGAYGTGFTGVYQNWIVNRQPDDFNNSGSSGEDCVTTVGSGFWNDVPCSYAYPFVCERVVR